MPDNRNKRLHIDLGAAAYFLAAAVIACFLFYVRNMVLADHDSLYEFFLARENDFSFAFDRALNFNLKRGRVGVVFPFVVAIRYLINGSGNYIAIWLLQYLPILSNIALIAHILRKTVGKGLSSLFIVLFAGLVQINRWHSLIICYPLDFMYGLFVMNLGLWIFYNYLNEDKQSGFLHYGKIILCALLAYESFIVYEPFFVSVGAYAILTIYFAINEEKTFINRVKYLFIRLWPVALAALIFLILFYLHLNSEFVDDSPSYPVGHNIRNTVYTWGVISGGMFPLIYFFYPSSSKELINVTFMPSFFKILISVLTFAASFVSLKYIAARKDTVKAKPCILMAIMGAFIAVFFALPHSLTLLYQDWVVNDHQAGYVPTTICYFGWILFICSGLALIVTRVNLSKGIVPVILALLIAVSTYLTYSVNDGFRSVDYGQSEAVCLKNQALYSLFRSDVFREEEIDLIYTPQYMGIHNATETNEELAEFESGNELDLTKYGDEFDALFDSYEHPARFEYDFERQEGILYLYDNDGDHEADRSVIIPIAR